MLWSLLLNRYVIGAGIGLALILGAYTKGHMDASANCHEAELRAKIETLNRDFSIAKTAAEDAVQRNNVLEIKKFESDSKVASYERELAQRKTDNCLLGTDDLMRLRGIDGSH